MSQNGPLAGSEFCRYLGGMNKWDWRKITMLAVIGVLVGCKEANPTVSLLRSLEIFDFENSNIVTSSLDSVSLKASCSSFIESVELSFDGGTSWLQPSAYDPSAKSFCENGIFSISLSNSKSPWNAMSFTSGQVMTVQFRALSRRGDWLYRNVNIKFTPSSPLSQELLVGSKSQTGSGLILKGRLRAQDQNVASGGGFVIHGRIAQ